jgi:hypothetical protein
MALDAMTVRESGNVAPGSPGPVSSRSRDRCDGSTRAVVSVSITDVAIAMLAREVSCSPCSGMWIHRLLLPPLEERNQR